MVEHEQHLETDPEGHVAQTAKAVTDKILTAGIGGAGPFKGAIPLAEEYAGQHIDTEKAIERLIAAHVYTTAASGFVSGLGGLATLPIALPADLTTLWIQQARLVAAIAHLRGYNVRSDEVRSVVLLTLLGSSGTEAMAKAGVTVGQKGFVSAIGKVSGKTLQAINKAVGFRLVTKAGTKGVVNLTKFVPVAGGLVGGGVNGVSTKTVGAWAKKNFPVVELTMPAASPS
ncbi:EcsC family protein [Arsenicicoccus piscis]|uniref:EcsC family protein n=1 Tax=Arsenicicoccus piscis TaxID=673954 RepID=A0ABQ6HWS6_9MICO|nr:EcsC family protein [Arsenicicoccus piscis]MCH8627375.1 EcsC family protein [Arsenicicoccus piscis]GMA21526.1 hypothetical protein GCM10025862_35470 [Arsenicicoccus piscis]GMA22154.1 hypothetical protein GCM10025862_41770 [Arsenicicoccus piscis]GMA22201.1 hypothetical protein GCM10025862_42240 [Arsenicicoccus piscis]